MESAAPSGRAGEFRAPNPEDRRCTANRRFDRRANSPSGILGRNPREIQNGIFALATWGVAALAALTAVGALIRLS